MSDDENFSEEIEDNDIDEIEAIGDEAPAFTNISGWWPTKGSARKG